MFSYENIYPKGPADPDKKRPDKWNTAVLGFPAVCILPPQ